MSRRALVTGAAGFVGSRLCASLAAREWLVTAIHRFDGAADFGPQVAARRLDLLADEQSWLEALRGTECVVHLAAKVHQRVRGPDADREYARVNVEASAALAERAVRAGVRRFVFVSTAKVNGEGRADRAYRAEDPPHPEDSYARSKLAAETALAEVSARTGLELVVIRPPLVYGPGVRANFLQLLKAVRSGIPLPLASIENRRSLVGLDNLVDLLELAMRSPAAAGRTWLVADGEDVSTPELVRRIASAMGRPARLLPFPVTGLRILAGSLGRAGLASRLCDSFMVDPTPAIRDLGWRPPMSLDEGLIATVREFERPVCR